MRVLASRRWVFLAAMLLGGCTSSGGTPDAGPPPDTGVGVDGGDADTGAPDAGACANPDRDGDGVRAVECGGADCDDADPNRFPGNVEVCDVANVDEDCDPTTFGVRDGDGDGYPDARCCNVDDTGTSFCGNDCADSMAGVHPSLAEACDSIDNDCDGRVDESLLPTTSYRDDDRDGFGVTETAMMGCGGAPAGYVLVGGDCDDTMASVSPAARELFGDGIDNDCDGEVDEPQYEVRGGIRPLGGSITDGAHTLSRTAIDGFPRVCDAMGTCVTGGIVSVDLGNGG